MKKSKIALLIAGCSMLVSCGRQKEITFEDATQIADDIIQKMDSESFENPTKLTVEVYQYNSNPRDGFEFHGKGSINFENQTSYQEFSITYLESGEKRAGKTWSFKEGDGHVVATDSEDKKAYFYTGNGLYYSFVDINYYVERTRSVAQLFSELSDEEIDEFKKSLSEYKFTTKGEGSFAFQGKQLDEYGKTLEAYYSIDKYLLKEVFTVNGWEEEKVSLTWGKATLFKKPDLSKFKNIYA